MTKAQAWKAAQERWGKRAIIQHRRGALLEAQKAPLRARRKEVQAQLAALPRGPHTVAERGRLLREERELFGQVFPDRYSVGQEMDILAAFHVMGSGDTWEAAFAQADARYPQTKRARESK